MYLNQNKSGVHSPEAGQVVNKNTSGIRLADNRPRTAAQLKLKEAVAQGGKGNQFPQPQNGLYLQRKESNKNLLPVQTEESSIAEDYSDTLSENQTPVVQRVQWATIGTALGAVAGAGLATLATGGMALPAVMAAAGALAGRKIGQNRDHAHLKSMGALAAFQTEHGGSSQGTLALIHANDNNYYMIEQQTNNRVKAAAEAIGIIYIKQGRKTAYHAEVRSIDWLKGAGIPLSGSVIWVSKPVCGYCDPALSEEGFKIKTPVTAVKPNDWVPPTGMQQAPVTEGVEYRGRRSQTEILNDWGMKNK